MRRLSLFAAAALVLLVLACDDDEGGLPPAETQQPVSTATPYAVKPAPTIVSGLLAAPQGEQRYIVEDGDTLSVIAEQFGTTSEAIMERNNIDDPSALVVGQELVIPVSAESEAADGDDSPNPGTSTDDNSDAGTDPGGLNDDGTYEVQSGDIASLIAEQFGVTLEELAAANGMTEADLDQIQPGDLLIIPGQ